MEVGMLTKTRKMLNTRGFSMVELLAVTTVIGVLSAVAVPQFSSYKAKSCNSAALSDLRNVKTVLEGYYKDHGRYPG
jgi:type IV pilus assembly protein PilA